MKALTTAYFKILFVFVLVGFTSRSFGQCTIDVPSTQGYTVHITLTPTGIVVPATCQYGYNFDVLIRYNVTFTGTNLPGSLYTLQGNISCSSYKNIFFDLPNEGGSGTAQTSGNVWRSQHDCQTASVESLGCNEFTIEIQGPGIKTKKISCTAPLPVELLYFDGIVKNNEVEFNWATASEENNDFFTIESSLDGTNWDTVATVPGAGTTTNISNYSKTVEMPEAKMVFYRLKQTDFDGKFTFSKVVAVQNTLKVSKLKLAPNPANTEVTISTEKALGSLMILNSLGQDVSASVTINSESESEAKLDITQLPNGLYTIITAQGTTKLQKN
ncbi:MAG: hypothetical protein GC181_09880 [Bacteroidetes bacterium]|nr:hypothetical protein [Bacteroidota bacterium]